MEGWGAWEERGSRKKEAYWRQAFQKLLEANAGGWLRTLYSLGASELG